MTPVLVGSNPGLVWRDAAGDPTAAVSVWDVQWSPVGAGRCLVYWPGGAEVHAFGVGRGLVGFVWEGFTRHFPEFRWAGERVVHFHERDVALVLTPGLVAATVAGSDPSLRVELRGSGSEPRPVRVAEFPLGEQRLELRNVLFPVADHLLQTSLPAPGPEAGWDGFIALAEVWLRQTTIDAGTL